MLEDRKIRLDLAPAVLAGLTGLLLMALVMRASDLRLYWEYGGMLTGGVYTPGFSDWVQQRVGELRPIDGVFRDPLSPYSDFTCEYPPGILLIFAALRFIFPSIGAFSVAYATFAAAIAALSITYIFSMVVKARLTTRKLWFTVGAIVAWIYLAGSFIVTRFDIFTVPLVLGAITSMQRKHFGLAGAFLGFGAAIKLWPALLVLPFAIYALGPDWRWRAACFTSRRPMPGLWLCVCSALAFAIPHLIMIVSFGTSPADSFGYLNYMAERPAQIESAVGNLSALITVLSGSIPETLFSFGSHNVTAPEWVLAGAQLVMFFGYAAILLLTPSLVKRDTASAETLGLIEILACLAGAIVVLALLTSKVFSGEYLIWLMPFVFLSGTRRDITLYCAALAILKLVYSNYDAVTSAQLAGSLLVFAKNLMLIALGVSFVASLFARSRHQMAIRMAAT
ncbi:glycosyltransferase family 87 protein [Devosia submarina]|uniref:glycosyltransferase family 87 protein n=1 Tax=Devosia submarina TaxID=1173082 RepID=UPI000D37186E|nr:glycosyltransferase family 87 protein [Devosia submarina]